MNELGLLTEPRFSDTVKSISRSVSTGRPSGRPSLCSEVRPIVHATMQDDIRCARMRPYVCPHCGRRGHIVDRIAGWGRFPSLWEVSCLMCGERWWIEDQERG